MRLNGIQSYIIQIMRDIPTACLKCNPEELSRQQAGVREKSPKSKLMILLCRLVSLMSGKCIRRVSARTMRIAGRH